MGGVGGGGAVRGAGGGARVRIARGAGGGRGRGTVQTWARETFDGQTVDTISLLLHRVTDWTEES